MHLEIIDTRGHVWKSDPMTTRQLLTTSDDSVDEAMDNVSEVETMCEDFSTLRYISIITNGRKRYFNPANVICMTLIGFPNRSALEWARDSMEKGEPDPELDEWGLPK